MNKNNNIMSIHTEKLSYQTPNKHYKESLFKPFKYFKPLEKIPEKIPERIPEKIPERIPEKIPERIPEKIPEKIPERIPERICISNNNSETKPLNNIEIIYKKNIKKIYNVYQEKYKFRIGKDLNVTGFGDFIRGCFFLLDFCEKNNFESDVLINHPVSKFLKNSVFLNSDFLDLYFNVKKDIFSNVPAFMENNCDHHENSDNNIITFTGKHINEFTDFLINIPVYKNNIFIYNIMYPNNNISEKHKKYMRYLLEPTDEILNYTNNTLYFLQFSKSNYQIIHIRSGDDYFEKSINHFSRIYINKLIFEIRKIINNNTNNNFLLISDNLNVKNLLIEKIPILKYISKDITHLGEGVVQEDEKIKNTLLEFYLMAFSSAIYSFSCYDHGSGFSKWCAITFDIPYTCKLLKH